MITVLIVLGVLAVIAWYLFTGPLRSIGSGTTNVNVSPAGQPTTTTTINVNPPSAPNPAPAGGNNAPATKPAP
jgi:HAMP domain-containing protein